MCIFRILRYLQYTVVWIFHLPFSINLIFIKSQYKSILFRLTDVFVKYFQLNIIKILHVPGSAPKTHYLVLIVLVIKLFVQNYVSSPLIFFDRYSFLCDFAYK